MKKISWTIASSLLCTVLLAGCGPFGTATNTNTKPAQTTGSTAGNTSTAGNSAGNTTANTSGNSTGSSSTSSSSSVSTTTMSMATQEALVRQTMTLATQGKALDVPFAVQQNIGTVQKAWGIEGGPTTAGAGQYVTYSTGAAAFGLNKGMQIFDVRSFSKRVQSITAPAIESVLGVPAETRYTADSFIDMYPAGPDDQLLFVFSKNSSGSAKATVDHISVFWPAGTVNSMAATQPAPSVAVSSVTKGQVAFRIVNSPKGYRLVELEWIPQTGSAIVNTYSQALENPTSSGSAVRFGASSHNQTLDFFNKTQFSGSSGVVRVIYQAPSGAAMIGTSSTITLK